MRKLKRILAAASAAVMCAIPMLSSFSASAEASSLPKYNTYMLYCDGVNSRIADLEFNLNYTSDVIAEPSMKTSLCDGGTFNSIHYTTSRKVTTTYKGAAIGQTGTLATTKFLFPYSSTAGQGFYDKVSISSVIKNVSGSNLGPSAIIYDAVLLGDTNNDGQVSMPDAVLIKQYITNPARFPIDDERTADVNGDGAITDDDALMIQEFCLQLISHF